MGSMAAVWELSHRPEIQQRYDIVVYQQGWRLGGKAASGRNPDAHQRIEEHGLHVWMGFYQNAFRVVRECYTELTGDADAWKQYFVPHGHIALEQRWNGAWKHWHLDFPTRQQLVPGDAVETPSPWQYVRRMLWTMAHMADDSPYLQSLGMPSRLFTEKPTLLRVLRTQLDRVDLQLGRILPFNNGDKASDALGELFTRVLKLAVTLPEDAAPPDAEQQRVLVWLLDKLRQGLRATLGRLADAELRRRWRSPTRRHAGESASIRAWSARSAPTGPCWRGSTAPRDGRCPCARTDCAAPRSRTRPAVPRSATAGADERSSNRPLARARAGAPRRRTATVTTPAAAWAPRGSRRPWRSRSRPRTR